MRNGAERFCVCENICQPNQAVVAFLSCFWLVGFGVCVFVCTAIVDSSESCIDITYVFPSIWRERNKAETLGLWTNLLLPQQQVSKNQKCWVLFRDSVVPMPLYLPLECFCWKIDSCPFSFISDLVCICVKSWCLSHPVAMSSILLAKDVLPLLFWTWCLLFLFDALKLLWKIIRKKWMLIFSRVADSHWLYHRLLRCFFSRDEKWWRSDGRRQRKWRWKAGLGFRCLGSILDNNRRANHMDISQQLVLLLSRCTTSKVRLPCLPPTPNIF